MTKSDMLSVPTKIVPLLNYFYPFNVEGFELNGLPRDRRMMEVPGSPGGRPTHGTNSMNTDRPTFGAVTSNAVVSVITGGT